MPILETNINNQGSRIYALTGTGVADIGGINSIGFQPQLTSSSTPVFPTLCMRGIVGNVFIYPAVYYNFPTNEWLFMALTYDSVSGNAIMYYGSEASPAKMYVKKNIGAGTNFNFSGTPASPWVTGLPGAGLSRDGLVTRASILEPGVPASLKVFASLQRPSLWPGLSRTARFSRRHQYAVVHSHFGEWSQFQRG